MAEQRREVRRRTGFALFAGVALTGAILMGVKQSSAVQTALVRGNAPGEWRYWGADAWSTRYSDLTQINAQNFDSLQIAWTWSAKSFGTDEYYRTTPLFAKGADGKGRIFTVATTRRSVFAVDPTTGENLWTYRLDEGIRWYKAPRQFAGRGVAYWTDGRGTERVLVVTPGYHMVSLDARTGIPDPKFGVNGVVDLEENYMGKPGLRMVKLAIDSAIPFTVSDENGLREARPGETWDPIKGIGADGTVGIDPMYGDVAASCPPIVVGDMIVVGESAIHGYYPVRDHNIPGTVRGFDVRTGKFVWNFNLIPQKGEFGDTSWHNGSAPGFPGVGKNDAYGVFSADPELGLVYIPVGMPLSDEYGGLRPGSNLFGNSIVALDAKTGKRKWHFQVTHHDVWDWDVSMSPNLLDVTVNGQQRKIVVQVTKQGWAYTFDRVTGEPIWPIPEMPVPAAEIPLEEMSPTQPIPTKPAPYSRQGMGALIDYTPALRDSAMKLASRNGLCFVGPYYLPQLAPEDVDQKHQCTYIAPGASGGVNVDGGAAADPETGFLYVGAISSTANGPGQNRVERNPCSELPFEQGKNSCGNSSYINGKYVRHLTPVVTGGIAGHEHPGGASCLGARPGTCTVGVDPRAAAAGAAGAGAAGAGAAGAGAAGGRGGGGGGGGGGAGAAVTQIGGISIYKPNYFGGITAYNMNTGDKAWWIPNGGAPKQAPPTPTDMTMFQGVRLDSLPGQAIGGQAEVIATKSLLIYGPGRNGGGGPRGAGIYAVDKATGRQVGFVSTPTANSAVPMTYLNNGTNGNGKQYIVFATTDAEGFEQLIGLAVGATRPGGRGGRGGAGAAAAPGGGGAGAAPAAAPAAGARGGGGRGGAQ